jgi:hypothetical protein
MAAGAPQEIREALARMQSGRGTPADMQRYQAWAMQQMPKHMDEMKSMLGGLFNPPRAAPGPQKRPQPQPQRTKHIDTAARQRLEALRPLLREGVDDQVVLNVFSQRAVFAEDVLAEFLPLVGIAADYAHLSYQYLGEAAATDLDKQNIRFVQHLQFQTK